LWRVGGELAPQRSGDGAFGDQRPRDLLVVHGADFLERVGERIVSDVVEQRRRPEYAAVARVDVGKVAALLEEPKRAPGEVIGAERVLEPAVRRAGIHEEREPQLPHVAQALKD